ncbi:MAG: DUF4783 domain-containing protein [Prevotellaceae bacterium]|nr:DUF4783 domain-containing protein [Prevotellaceae bacterium]
MKTTINANIRVIFVAAALALLLSDAAVAVNPNNVVEIFKEVSGSLKSGDTSKLTTHFVSSVDLRILATEKTCTAQQAAAAVKEFFSQHKPVNFTMLHVGSKANKHYGIGMLSTNGGRFRVTIFLLITEPHRYNIQQLCIDYED